MTEQSDRTRTTSGPELVLHEERLRVSTERLPVERVLLRKVVVTETRQVEVTVRREELHVVQAPVDAGTPARPADAAHGPLVIVLAQEVPVVQLHTAPYETVTVHVDSVPGLQPVSRTLSRESAELSTDVPAQLP